MKVPALDEDTQSQPKRRPKAAWRPAVLAIVAAMVAAYCYLGVAMNASFSVATESRGHDIAALLYLIGCILSALAALTLGIVAWKRRHRGSALDQGAV
ncbi:MAG: hypothetical protein IH616_16030 [Gemmatimonadales bacterium]|nr:hypothetical protein [Gemmatimonadales bacterium]